MRWLLLGLALLCAQVTTAHAQFSQQTSLSTAGVSNLLFAGTPNHPFTANGESVFVTITGTANCTVQVSADPVPVWPPPPALQLPNWNSHDILVSLTASAQSSIAWPFSAIRLNCASLTGTAILTLVNY